MEFITKYESPLNLQKLFIAECSFRRSENPLMDLKIDVQINRTIEETKENVYKVGLEVSMKDNAENLYINVHSVAYFETAQNMVSLIEKNAIAIMFPYVRSYISIITAQPGMSPIVLPPMNIAAMFQDD